MREIKRAKRRELAAKARANEDQAGEQLDGSYKGNVNNDGGVNGLPEAPKERELRGIYKFLDCFDAWKNFQKIINVKYTDSYDFNLEIFNGTRVFMLLYVIFGHTFLFGTTYVDNLPDIPILANTYWLLILSSALFSVDVFFYMSGFLSAYIGIGKFKKMKPTPLNYVGVCLHRFLRIWPTYTLAILFFWRILPLMGSGPVWFQMTYFTSLCDSTVWQNLLFLDDFLVESATYCYGWGWYLSNDFQMFIITPLFLWLYCRKRNIAKIAMWVLIAISWGIALIVGAELDVSAAPPRSGGVTNGAIFADYYVKPYIRLPPYFIGVLAALAYKEYKEKTGLAYKVGSYLEKSMILKNLIWALGVCIVMMMSFLVRILQENPNAWPEWFQVAWRAFQKSLYVIGITFIFTPILLGDNTLLKRLLSHPILVPLARLSFTAYLVHLFWVYQNYYNMVFSYHFTIANGILNTLSNAVIAFLTAVILSLIAEVPFSNLETTYISGAKRSRRPRPASPEKDKTVPLLKDE